MLASPGERNNPAVNAAVNPTGLSGRRFGPHSVAIELTP